MTNQYDIPLRRLCDTVANIQLNAFHFRNVLEDTKSRYESPHPNALSTVSGVGLIIKDWSGPNDDGWAINYHTGSVARVQRETYRETIDEMLSNYFLLCFSQVFERLNSYLKDCLIIKGRTKREVLSYYKGGSTQYYTRENLPVGDALFKLSERSAELRSGAIHIPKNIDLMVFWTVVSVVRHSITHSSGLIAKKQIDKSRSHSGLFKHLFPSAENNVDNYQLRTDFKQGIQNLVTLAEFAFQFYKAFSISDGYDWKHFIIPEDRETKK